jgi:hypothetical protein
VPWTFADAVAAEGAGLLAAPAQAARIILTAIPPGFGLISGEPDLYYDLGHVLWLVGDAAGEVIRLRAADTLITGAPLGVTGLAYSLRPFVSGTIAAGWWQTGIGLGDGRLAPAGADPAAPGWAILG